MLVPHYQLHGPSCVASLHGWEHPTSGHKADASTVTTWWMRDELWTDALPPFTRTSSAPTQGPLGPKIVRQLGQDIVSWEGAQVTWRYLRFRDGPQMLMIGTLLGSHMCQGEQDHG